MVLGRRADLQAQHPRERLSIPAISLQRGQMMRFASNPCGIVRAQSQQI